jgi:uncharacterized membrane protein
LKIKIINGLLIVDILTVLLVLAIIFLPSSVIRIILGIPFFLFFPGYSLVAALFVNKENMDNLEKVAISVAMSIATVALIGFGLNYSAWGIKLEPVLYSIAVFIIVMSIIAFIRRAFSPRGNKLTVDFKFTLPGWQTGAFDRYLSITLVVCILGALGILGYTISGHKAAEKFTEFYVLGFHGKAQDYPTEFIIDNHRISSVRYGTNIYDIANEYGKVTLGIVNHEQQKESYSLKLQLDGEPVEINFEDARDNQSVPIELQSGEKWEQVIRFIPQHTGDKQKLELLLFKGSNPSAVDNLHLWINVKPAPELLDIP